MIAALLLQRPPCPPFCPPPDTGVSDATAWILLGAVLVVWAAVKTFAILRKG